MKRRFRPSRPARLPSLVAAALMAPLVAQSALQLPCPVTKPISLGQFSDTDIFNAIDCVVPDGSAIVLGASYTLTNTASGHLNLVGFLQQLGGTFQNEGLTDVGRGIFVTGHWDGGTDPAFVVNTGSNAVINSLGSIELNAFSTWSNLAGAQFFSLGDSRSVVRNQGTIVNDGATFNNGLFLPGPQLFNTGSIVNSGGATMINQTGASFANSAGGSLLNTGDSLFENAGSLVNDGPGTSFVNSAYIDNIGLLSNRNGALLHIDVGGSIDVENNGVNGQILNTGGSTVRNDGSMSFFAIDTASFAGQLTNDASTFINAASVQLAGSIVNQNAGIVRSTGAGALIQIAASGTLLNDLGSTFSNEAGASVVNLGGVTNQAGSSLVNDGIASRFTLAPGAVLVNQGAGTQLVNRNGASLVNSGSISNLNGADFTSDASASLLNTQGGQILNNAATMALASAVNDGGGSALVNAGGATLTLNGSFTNQYGALLANQTGSTVNVSGTLQNPSGQIVNNGTVNVLASGSLVSGGGFDNNGQVSSAGSFTVALGGTMDGAGTYLQTAGTGVVDGVMTQGVIDIEGGVLKGTGTIAAASFIVGPGGVISPGHSPGTLTLKGNVQFAGELDIEVASATLFDRLIVQGAMTLAPGTRIVLVFDQPLADASYSFDFLQASGGLSGFSPSMISAPGGYGGYGAGWTEACDARGQCTLQLHLAAAVPEPGRLPLLLAGMAAMGVAGRRRRA